MDKETRQSLDNRIDEIATPGSLLGGLMKSYLAKATALGDAAEQLCNLQLCESLKVLGPAAADRARIERERKANDAIFRAHAALFEHENDEIDKIVAQKRQAAREAMEAHEREQAIQRDADEMNLGQVMVTYGDRLSVNVEGKIIAARGAGLSYRDRIIIKRWEEKLLPILRQRNEVEIL